MDGTEDCHLYSYVIDIDLRENLFHETSPKILLANFYLLDGRSC
jgi:hypothetical protein